MNKTVITTLLIATLLLSTGCASLELSSFDHQGSPVTHTPYDERYKKIKTYLREAKNRISYKAEKKGRDYWQPPFETEELGTGDCEDMAIWLYSKLLKDGIDNIRLVVGKYKSLDTNRHAWINLYHDGHVYIIDPTMDTSIWRAEQFPEGYYKPLYSFYKNEKWKHSN